MPNSYRRLQKDIRNMVGGFHVRLDIYRDIARGDVDAGTLLSKLAHIFITPKMTYERNGKFWRAETKEQWEKDIWLPRRSLDRAIQILSSLGIIKVKLMRVFRYGKTMLHIHLNEQNLSSFIDNHQKLISTETPNGISTNTPIIISTKTPIVKEHKKVTKELSIGICVAQKTGNEKQQKTKVTSNLLLSGLKKEKVPSKRKKGETMLAKDVMVKLNQASAEKYDDSFVPKNKTDLMGFWVYIVKLHHDTGYTKTGIKELGQLGHLMSGLKKQGIPVVPVLRWAVEYWKAFAMLAKQEKNATLPSIPEIGKLLMYIDVAVNGMQGGKHKGLQSIAKNKELTPTKFFIGHTLAKK